MRNAWAKGPKRCFGPFGLLLMLSACYTYQPVSTPVPEVGSRISVQLTDNGTRDLWNHIGPSIRHVEGDVMTADSTKIELAVRQVENQRGIQSDWNGERVTLPRTSLAGMQEKRLSWGGTGLMAGIAGVGLYALYKLIGGPGTVEGNPGSGGGSGPQ